MHTEFVAFGEMLWDCLPSGRHAGGAPFNVSAHLAQLGVGVELISAVGNDALGEEILGVARGKSVGTRWTTQVGVGFPTGMVNVRLDGHNNATYEIVRPAAWDKIHVAPGALAAVANARALVFGSLACRSPENRAQLDRLLAIEGPRKFFDVNLRPPFVDPALVLELAGRCDVIKLNDDELGRLASYVRTGELRPDEPATEEAISRACATVAEAAGATCVCVTRGARGAALWKRGELTGAPAPRIVVRDTVGAGDAFMAGFMVGMIGGLETGKMLTAACELGGYVASFPGATPPLPPEIVAKFSSTNVIRA